MNYVKKVTAFITSLALLSSCAVTTFGTYDVSLYDTVSAEGIDTVNYDAYSYYLKVDDLKISTDSEYNELKSVKEYTESYYDESIRPEFSGMEDQKVIEVPVEFKNNIGFFTISFDFEADNRLTYIGVMNGVGYDNTTVSNNNNRITVMKDTDSDTDQEGVVTKLLFALPPQTSDSASYEIKITNFEAAKTLKEAYTSYQESGTIEIAGRASDTTEDEPVISDADYDIQISKSKFQKSLLKTVSDYSGKYTDGDLAGDGEDIPDIDLSEYNNNLVVEVPVYLYKNAGLNTAEIKFGYDSELKFMGLLRDGDSLSEIGAPIKVGVKKKKILLDNGSRDFKGTGKLATLLFILPSDVKPDFEYKIEFDAAKPFVLLASKPFEYTLNSVTGYAMITDKQAPVVTAVPETTVPVVTVPETTVPVTTVPVTTTVTTTKPVTTVPVTTMVTTTKPVTTVPVTTTVTTTKPVTTVPVTTTVTTTKPVTTAPPVTTEPVQKKPVKFVMDTVSCERTSNTDTSVTMKIKLKDNAIGLSAFQGNLIFGDGDLEISSSEIYPDAYAGQWKQNSKGNIIQFISDSGHNIEPKDDVFAEITLLIPASVPAGEYDISLDEISISVLTEEGQKKYTQIDNVFEVEKGKISITDSFNIDIKDNTVKIPEGMTASQIITSLPSKRFYYSYEDGPFDLTGLKVEVEKYVNGSVDGKIEIGEYVRVKDDSVLEYDSKRIAYDIPLEINPDMLIDGKFIEVDGQKFDITELQKSFDGTTIRVYIGQRGDVNLDGKIDTRDATDIIKEYSATSMGDESTLPEIIKKSSLITPEMIEKDLETINEFCLFLGDVSVNSTTAHVLDTRDETGIIKFYNEYSMASIMGNVDVKAIWETIYKK